MRPFFSLWCAALLVLGGYSWSFGEAVSAPKWDLLNDPNGDIVDYRESLAPEQARKREEEKKAEDQAARRKLERRRELERRIEAQGDEEASRLARLRELAAREKDEAARLGLEVTALRTELERLQKERRELEEVLERNREACRLAEGEAIRLSSRILTVGPEVEQLEAERRKKWLEFQESEAELIRLSGRILDRQADLAKLERGLQPSGGNAEEGALVSTTADPDPDPRRDNPAPQAAVIGENPAADYVIGPGDVIDIAVWRDEALTRSVIVSPDGRFSFPLIGEVAAQGKTVSELKAELEKSIGRFVPDPVLSLELKQANSMQIYVIGKVNNPGRFVIQSHVNVLQALAMAGGLNPFARESRIRILRQDTIGGTASFPFDYDRVTRGKDLEQNIRLKRGDVVIVP